MLRLKLSKPPSTNKLFANVPGKGRVKTKAYEAWIKAMGNTLTAQRARPVSGPVEIAITVDHTSGLDLDNACKASIDLMVRMGIITGDGYKIVKRITMEWGDVAPFMGVEMGAVIEIAPWAGDGRSGTA